jgi:hypothetical protein
LKLTQDDCTDELNLIVPPMSFIVVFSEPETGIEEEMVTNLEDCLTPWELQGERGNLYELKTLK